MNAQMQDFLLKSAEELKSFLVKMANQMGVAVEHLYGVLVKQAFVNGIELILLYVFLFVLFCIAFVRASRAWKAVPKNGWNEECRESVTAGFWLVITIILAGCVTIGFNGWFTNGIKHVINPEYYALQDVFDFIKGNVDKIKK